MEANSKINEPESRGGIPAMMRAIAALAVVVLAMVGVLVVAEVIPLEALREWATKAGLILLILVAAVVAIAVLARGRS
jgi:hypothetical protein